MYADIFGTIPITKPCLQRCFARRCRSLYDGRYYAFAPASMIMLPGGQTETAWYFHWNMCC